MNFDDFLNTYAGAPRELPLVHNTLCLRLPQLQSTGVLEPRGCSVFGEPLLYFFYGRPVFEPNGIGDQPDTCFDFWPVCFVFRLGAVASWARVFPLDSGAVNGGRFLPLIDPCDLKHYELVPAAITAQRLVEAFFETNGSYYVGQVRKLSSAPTGDQEVEGYWQIITWIGKAKFDQRRSAIEVQSRTAASLRNSLYAVIMPTGFLEDENLLRTVSQDWGALPITYPSPLGTIPRYCMRDICNEFRFACRAFFE
jgi:hypothetical protein